jgi:prevent-host-death family protein
MTQTMTISAVKNTLSSVVTEVSRKETRVLIERDGIPIAALVSAEDLDRLNQLDQGWDERTKAFGWFSRAFADVPATEAEAEVARIIAERRRRRAAKPERQTA